MRKLIWATILVLLIALAIVGTAAISLNRIIAHNRDRILQQARSAIGRPVLADQIVMSLWGGIGVRVDNVRVADDPQFSDSDFVYATAVVAQAKVLPLLRGRLDIGRIDIEQPRIHLIRDTSNRWNYQTLGPPKPAAHPEAGRSATAASVSPSSFRL